MGQVSNKAPKLQSNTLTHKLADIELQLIMHGLEAKEIIRLARCNHRLMQAADSAFAWKYSLLQVNATLPHLSSIASSRLLRHIPSSLHLSMTSDDFGLFVALPLTVWSNVRELHCLDRDGIHSPRFSRLLELPILQQSVHVIIDHAAAHRMIDDGEHAESMQLLSEFSHLHTLVCKSRSEDSEGWSLMAKVSTLTSLALTDWMQHSHLTFVAQCNHLQHLAVTYPKLGGSSFFSFCSLPTIRQLQSLAFDCFMPTGDAMSFLEPIPAADLTAGFAALTSMHSFRITRLMDCSDEYFLPHIVHAPALTSLTIVDLPSMEIMTELLVAAPRLHLTVVRLPGDKPCKVTRKLMGMAKFAHRIHTRVEADDDIRWMMQK